MLLFILKKFYDYNGVHQVSNGLKTSASFVVEMLKLQGHKARIDFAIDGNCIDRIVTEHRPRIVILEAIWVTPEKLEELRRLHPTIRWIVRVHSEIPFLANEGMSMGWLAAYVKLGVVPAFNSTQAQEDFSVVGESIYLPNYYPLRQIRYDHRYGDEFHVGCFGAIRPMKNQLIQCLAAIRCARSLGKKLYFHMNGSRLEQGGSNNLKAITATLEATDSELILHEWEEHEEFLETIASMSICLQVSLTESFNIVSADAVSMGVPLIGSSAIRWLPRRSCAPVDSAERIAEKMYQADQTTVLMNHMALEDYTNHAVSVWNDFATKEV